MMHTPSGRFEVNMRLCLSMSKLQALLSAPLCERDFDHNKANADSNVEHERTLTKADRIQN